MVVQFLDVPDGPHDAIRGAFGRLSFDDLHRLRPLVRSELENRLPNAPRRILGCLQDNEKALLALLFVTEVTDYMPINPDLSDTETATLVQASGADVAILSSAFVGQKAPLQTIANCLDWDDIVDTALGRLNADHPPPPISQSNTGRLILHTSGSTGSPKRVPITLAAMNASAQNIAVGHELTAEDHALNALPTFHIGALVDVMLAPFAAGGSISITDKRGPQDLVKALIETRPTWFQVVPTLLRRLVEDIEPQVLTQAGESLRFIRSISAPLPPDLKAEVEQLFGCPVIEMYGMTETAGQIATQSRDQSAYKSGSVGKPVGVDVAIMDRVANRLSTGQTGEVCVKGPTVFDGYEGTTRDDVFFEDWFRTGDLGQLDQDGYLFLKGRLKEMINVGGEKVSPHEVEIAALQIPDVIEAAAYCVPHPTLGEQVGLSIATRSTVTETAVKAFLDTQLVAFKCPNAISIVDQLPRLANAKVDRLLLKRTAEADWQQRQSGSARTTVIHTSAEAQAVALHWSRVLKSRPPEGDDDFFDMGGDSLSATQLLLLLEKALNREISPNQLFEAPTFAGLVESLSQDAEASQKTAARPIRFIQEKTVGWPGQVAVAGGLLRSIGSLKTGHPLFWSSQAQSEIDAIVDVIGHRRPIYVTGSLRRFRNRTEQDFETVGLQLASEIMAIQPDGPIALGGFCGGAWVMHHTAEALIKHGRDIRVFVSFDYWPSRELSVPTLHCMSRCEINSARVNYARHTVAESLLHSAGMLALDIDSKHRFDAEHIEPHRAVLNTIIDGKDAPPDVPVDPKTWPLQDRLQPPSAKITVSGRPRFYQAGGTATFSVTVKNTSQVEWAPTDISGLSIQADLINLDGHMRKANVCFGAFDDPVPPQGSASFTFTVTFPTCRVPLWLSCNLVSQGLVRFSQRASGASNSIIFPSLFKAKPGLVTTPK